jgi:sugar-specific transcriptional regulator TrmB
MPGAIAKNLWPTRNVIGHPAAPSVASASEEEAREMVMQWARALADATRSLATPAVSTLINVDKVGDMLVAVLQRLDQLLESQQKMYEEYLELKRRQVQLLERAGGRSSVAD